MKFTPTPRYTKIALYSAGVILWTTFCVLIGVYFPVIERFFSTLCKLLRPMVYGCVIAVLCHPFLRSAEEYLRPLTDARRPRPKLRRILAMLGTYLTLAGILTLFFAIFIPQFVRSYTELSSNFSLYLSAAQDWIDRLVEQYPMFRVIFPQPDGVMMGKPMAPLDENGNLIPLTFHTIPEAQANVMLQEIHRTLKTVPHFDLGEVLRNMLQQSYLLLSDLSPYLLNFLLAMINETKNLLIGLVVSVYVLAAHERLIRSAETVFESLLPRRWMEHIRTQKDFIRQVFDSFVTGKIVDALLIGVLCGLILWVAELPYAMLLSLVIAIMSVVPYIGLFLGAIPCLFIVLMTAPEKTWIFLLLILTLQLLEVRFIEPYWLRSHTWLSAEWVIIAAVLFSGIFGFFGMFIAAPVFTIIYHECKIFLEKRLKNAGLSTQTIDYMVRADSIDTKPPGKGKTRWRKLKTILRRFS